MTGGATPFAFAVSQGCLELGKLLLSHEADIVALGVTQISDIFFTGMTALGRLAMQGCDTPLAKLKFVLDGARKKKSRIYSSTRYRIYCPSCCRLSPREGQTHPETVVNLKFFLSIFNQKHDLDRIDRFGCTALHLAVILGDYEAVQTLLDAGARHDIQLYRCLDIRPIEIARVRVQNLIGFPLEEDLNRGTNAVALTLQRSMAVVDVLDHYVTSSTTEGSSSESECGNTVDPLIGNSYAMARGFIEGIFMFCGVWTVTNATETEFANSLLKAIENTSRGWGIENVNADDSAAAEGFGKGKSKAEDADELSFFHLPFWWMIMG